MKELSALTKEAAKLSHTLSKNVVDTAEVLCAEIIDDYFAFAVNNDMDRQIYTYPTILYFYSDTQNEENLFFSQSNELGLILAINQIKRKSKHGLLLRYKKNDNKHYTFEFVLSNRPMSMEWMDECYIYEIF